MLEQHTSPGLWPDFRARLLILGSLSLLPLIFIRWKNAASALPGAASPFFTRRFLLSSLAAGSCLFVVVILQQFGIMFTTAGNAGFILMLAGMLVTQWEVIAKGSRRTTGS